MGHVQNVTQDDMMLLLPPQQVPHPLGMGLAASLPPNFQDLASGASSSNFAHPFLHSEQQMLAGGRPAFPIPDLQHLLQDQSAGYMPASQNRLQGKRQLSDLNHNKAITKQLVSACHYQQVLDCVAQSAPIFDEVNVATALHRLARLQPPAPNNRASFIIQSKEFQLLVRAIKLHLPRFEAQAISNAMWAFATLSYFPQDNLLDELANKAVSIMPSFRPQAVSNTLWAFAKLGHLPPQNLLQAVAYQMLQDLPKSVPQDISNTLWAFATLRHHPGRELLDASSQQALSMFHKFKPQEIANLLWSFATMDYNPPGPLLDAMAIQMIARIQSFRPQAVSNSLWAYAKIGYKPGVMLLDVTALKAATMFHQYTSQEVANTLWALAALDHYPGSEMLSAAAIQLAKRLEHFTPQDIASTLWAFAKLGHHACRGLLPSVAMHVLKLWTRFTPTAVITLLEAFALLQGCPMHLWTQLLAKLFSLPEASLTSDNLWHLYHTFLLLEASVHSLGVSSFRDYFPADLLEAARTAWVNSVQKKAWLDPLHQDISQHLWALGVAHSNNEIVADGQLLVECSITGSNFSSSELKGAYLLQKLQAAQSQGHSLQTFAPSPAIQQPEAVLTTAHGLGTSSALPYFPPGPSVYPGLTSGAAQSSHPAMLKVFQQQQTVPGFSLESQQQNSLAQLSTALSSMPLQSSMALQLGEQHHKDSQKSLAASTSPGQTIDKPASPQGSSGSTRHPGGSLSSVEGLALQLEGLRTSSS